MNTAVIVSGILRYMPQASTSWKIKADYFLTVDKDFYEPQHHLSSGTILNDQLSAQLGKFSFKSINITTSHTPAGTENNSAVKMAWKWKVAYNNFLLYNQVKPYKNIIIIRPDLYLTQRSGPVLLPEIESNEVALTAMPHITARGLPWVNDFLLMFGPDTFEKLSGFYDYLINRHKSNSGMDVHAYLYEYLLLKDCIFSDKLKSIFTGTVIRETSLDMFDKDGLKPEFNVGDLATANLKWWNQKWKIENQ